MRILNVYQNTVYNKSYVKPSFGTARATVGSLEELASLPKEVREKIMDAAKAQGVELPSTRQLPPAIAKSTADSIRVIERHLFAAQKELGRIRIALEKAGLVIETEKPAKTVKSLSLPSADELCKGAYHKKARAYVDGMAILKAPDCSGKHALEVMETIIPQKIKEPSQRVELIEELIDFAVRTKDKKLLNKLKTKDFNGEKNYYRNYKAKSSYLIDSETIERLNKKLFDAVKGTKDGDLILDMYVHSDFLTNKEKVKLAMRATDKYDIESVLQNNIELSDKNVTKKDLKAVFENYIGICLRAEGHEQSTPQIECRNLYENAHHWNSSYKMRVFINEFAKEKYGIDLAKN